MTRMTHDENTGSSEMLATAKTDSCNGGNVKDFTLKTE